MDPRDKPEDDTVHEACFRMTTNSDLTSLEAEIVAEINGAKDLAALEALD